MERPQLLLQMWKYGKPENDLHKDAQGNGQEKIADGSALPDYFL
jgi:hypothetical protein